MNLFKIVMLVSLVGLSTNLHAEAVDDAGDCEKQAALAAIEITKINGLDRVTNTAEVEEMKSFGGSAHRKGYIVKVKSVFSGSDQESVVTKYFVYTDASAQATCEVTGVFWNR